MHWERRHRVVEVEDLALLCSALSTERFPLCAGFRYGTVTLLNDSFADDTSDAEYAVLRDGRQVDSFVVSRLDEDTLMNRIDLLDTMGTDVDLGRVSVLEHAEGRCEHCG